MAPQWQHRRWLLGPQLAAEQQELVRVQAAQQGAARGRGERAVRQPHAADDRAERLAWQAAADSLSRRCAPVHFNIIGDH